MEHNPISMGDIAYSMASRSESGVQNLHDRLTRAEDHIDFLVDVINALLDHMYGPDDSRKPDEILKVVKGFVHDSSRT